MSILKPCWILKRPSESHRFYLPASPSRILDLCRSIFACSSAYLRRNSYSGTHFKSIVHKALSFLQDAAQMIRSTEALCINFVDIFSSRWTHRVLSVLCYYLQPTNRYAVSRCLSYDGFNCFTCQLFIRRIRYLGIVGRNKVGHINQHSWFDKFSPT